MSTKLTDKSSIPAIMAEMTLEEKCLLIVGKTNFTTCPLEKYGIKECRVLDGCTGVNLYQYYGSLMIRARNNDPAKDLSASGVNYSVMLMRLLDKEAKGEPLDELEKRSREIINEEMDRVNLTREFPGCFPVGMMLGASWDPETVYLCANAVAKEMAAYQVDMVLGSPNVNIHRDPLNGRVFEGYSEDPCLTSKLAPNYVRGVQDEGLIADVKHFAANNQETHRMNVNEIISERALYEIYLPGFRACIQDAGCKSVMDAYNKINGTACSQNKWLLGDVLRKQWGFEGLVVSDWNAVYNRAAALEAGNDLQMPGPRPAQQLIDAVENGTLSMEAIDRAVRLMLEMLVQMPTQQGKPVPKLDREYSRKAAHQAAAEGAVLLKNRNGLLPLSKNVRLSFLGERSKKFLESGGGSAMVFTDQSTSLVDVTAETIGAENVTFGKISADSDAVVITVSAWGQEGNDRPSMDLDAADREMLLAGIAEAKKLKKRVIVILNVSGPVDMMDYIDDVDAVLCMFLPGMEGGRVASEILFGEINPSGKLPLTFPKHYRDCPTYGNFPGCCGEVHYGEGIYVGYRYYEFKGVEPLFPFGFGLSYSNFRISDLKLDRGFMNMDKGETVTATVKVKNLSPVDGKEVVQLYIRDPKSTLPKPFKELKHFQKVSLKAGEEKTVTFTVTKQDLASYDSEIHEWVSEAGRYEVLVGNSSDNVTESAEFRAGGVTAYNYNKNTMLITVRQDKAAWALLERELHDIGIRIQALEDCLYYFPHRTMERLLNLYGGKAFAEKEKFEAWKARVLEKLHSLDLSDQD